MRPVQVLKATGAWSILVVLGDAHAAIHGAPLEFIERNKRIRVPLFCHAMPHKPLADVRGFYKKRRCGALWRCGGLILFSYPPVCQIFCCTVIIFVLSIVLGGTGPGRGEVLAKLTEARARRILSSYSPVTRGRGANIRREHGRAAREKSSSYEGRLSSWPWHRALAGKIARGPSDARNGWCMWTCYRHGACNISGMSRRTERIIDGSRNPAAVASDALQPDPRLRLRVPVAAKHRNGARWTLEIDRVIQAKIGLVGQLLVRLERTAQIKRTRR